MRVFYAVTLNDDTKIKLSKYRDMVSKVSLKGSFTKGCNFHITLEFIGEISHDKLNILVNVLHKLNIELERINLTHIGSFNRKKKEIVWVGIDNNKELIDMQKELRKLLKDNGFKVEDRAYRPHITLGRQVVREKSLEDIEFNNFKAPIKSIALMESKRVEGNLVYEVVEEIFVKETH